MGCITSTNFVVLVNGKPTIFFKACRGLRQGYPMSRLLFLLIVEGLSRLIKKAKKDGRIEGIKMARVLNITHLFFVDEVVLFGKGTIEEW